MKRERGDDPIVTALSNSLGRVQLSQAPHSIFTSPSSSSPNTPDVHFAKRQRQPGLCNNNGNDARVDLNAKLRQLRLAGQFPSPISVDKGRNGGHYYVPHLASVRGHPVLALFAGCMRDGCEECYNKRRQKALQLNLCESFRSGEKGRGEAPFPTVLADLVMGYVDPGLVLHNHTRREIVLLNSFQFLDPLELFVIERVCKLWHSLLRCEGSVKIWHAAAVMMFGCEQNALFYTSSPLPPIGLGLGAVGGVGGGGAGAGGGGVGVSPFCSMAMPNSYHMEGVMAAHHHKVNALVWKHACKMGHPHYPLRDKSIPLFHHLHLRLPPPLPPLPFSSSTTTLSSNVLLASPLSSPGSSPTTRPPRRRNTNTHISPLSSTPTTTTTTAIFNPKLRSFPFPAGRSMSITVTGSSSLPPFVGNVLMNGGENRVRRLKRRPSKPVV